MQAVNDEQFIDSSTSNTWMISAETVAYIVLILLAVTLGFASLGDVAMTDAEAIQALPAYHAVDANAAGTAQPAQSVVVYWLQRISFTFFGGSEFSARLPGVLGGIALLLMPLLFRSRLGREQVFIMSLMLAFSPIAFTASRFTDTTIWTMIFAIGLLWAGLAYWDLPIQENAIKLAGFLGAMLFLTGSSGLILSIIFLLTIVVTVAWTIFKSPEERDAVGDDVLTQVSAWMRNLPIVPMLLTTGGLTIVVATGFLIDTSGLNIVAVAISKSLGGFLQSSSAEAPNFYAVTALFVYEPLLIVLGFISIAMMIGSDSDTVIDRFVISWLGVGFVVLLIYQGSLPAQALLLTLPLTYLTARLISELLVNYMPSFLSLDAYDSNDPNDYIWVKWIVALVVFAGFIMMSLYLATLGRALLNYPNTQIVFNFEQSSILLYARFGWFVIMAILMVVVYFLFASMWGNRGVLQGYGLGTFIFMLMMGIGTGWNTAVENVSNPAELWYTSGISADAYELRETLFDVAERQTRGFPAINLTILRDEASGITGDGLIAWLVRDFDNARFVDTLAEVRQQEIILLPQMEEDPDLGGSYVGQSFVIREQWVSGVSSLDYISWFTHRKTRPYELPQDNTVLWLRIDVYDGAPAVQSP